MRTPALLVAGCWTSVAAMPKGDASVGLDTAA